MRQKLYTLALWYIEKCNKKWNKSNNALLKSTVKSLNRLTYRVGDKAYLSYGVDDEWQKFSRYAVLDNAIQKLADYEDAENHSDETNNVEE